MIEKINNNNNNDFDQRKTYSNGQDKSFLRQLRVILPSWRFIVGYYMSVTLFVIKKNKKWKKHHL